jgi:hypothetical protein
MALQIRPRTHKNQSTKLTDPEYKALNTRLGEKA